MTRNISKWYIKDVRNIGTDTRIDCSIKYTCILMQIIVIVKDEVIDINLNIRINCFYFSRVDVNTSSSILFAAREHNLSLVSTIKCTSRRIIFRFCSSTRSNYIILLIGFKTIWQSYFSLINVYVSVSYAIVTRTWYKAYRSSCF